MEDKDTDHASKEHRSSNFALRAVTHTCSKEHILRAAETHPTSSDSDMYLFFTFLFICLFIDVCIVFLFLFLVLLFSCLVLSCLFCSFFLFLSCLVFYCLFLSVLLFFRVCLSFVRSFSLSVFLSVCLSVCLSFLPSFFPSFFLSLPLSLPPDFLGKGRYCRSFATMWNTVSQSLLSCSVERATHIGPSKEQDQVASKHCTSGSFRRHLLSLSIQTCLVVLSPPEP